LFGESSSFKEKVRKAGLAEYNADEMVSTAVRAWLLHEFRTIKSQFRQLVRMSATACYVDDFSNEAPLRSLTPLMKRKLALTRV
jgi:hypothetical protein